MANAKSQGAPATPRMGWTSLAVMAAMTRLGADASVSAIVDEVERVSGRRIAGPQMYLTLPRLERWGLVRREGMPSRPVQGGRRKDRYELTAAGVEALRTLAPA